MNKQITELNDTIALCDKAIEYICLNGNIRQNNEIYLAYKAKISKFLKENNLIIKDYPPYIILDALYFENGGYSVNLSEMKMIREMVIRIKNEKFGNHFDKIFISHREKDKAQVDALIELLYALGIPRPTQDSPESMIFCSSHPNCYISNGLRNLDEIKRQFDSSKNSYYVLWYTRNYFESQACMNEAGAIWITGKNYQEILAPAFDEKTIGGLLDKQPVWFRADDKFRLNTFRDDIERMFELPSLVPNAWELARDAFLTKIVGG